MSKVIKSLKLFVTLFFNKFVLEYESLDSHQQTKPLYKRENRKQGMNRNKCMKKEKKSQLFTKYASNKIFYYRHQIQIKI